MTHLNIQQGLNIEVVTTLIIKKLYEAALSVPEPLEGELDAAYMSGNLLVAKTYRSLVEYLTNRFNDLHINVTDSYYIPFEDSDVLNVLLANNIGSDGIGVTEAEAANATLTTSTFLNNTDITSFNTFKYFTKANNNPPNDLFRSCSNLASVDMSNITALSSSEFRGTALTNVTLPNSVTEISAAGFSLNNSLTTVTAPNILIIGRSAFDSCGSLTSFSDFSKVTTIGDRAFSSAPLTGVFNAPNLTTLGTLAFKGHNFEGIECIGTVSFIPANAFGSNYVYNTLQYVYLPYECTRLDNDSLCRAQTLTTVKQYDKTISDYQEGETKTFLPNLGKITVFGNLCFRECKTLILTSDDITNATGIGSSAFLQCYALTGAISLPNLTSLGQYAFYNCTGITSVDLTGSTITSIPSNCFNECSSLTTVTIPSTVNTIGLSCFSKCDNVDIISSLDNITSIGNELFLSTNLNTILSFRNDKIVSFPSLTYLGYCPFANCSFKLLYIPILESTNPKCEWGNSQNPRPGLGGAANRRLYCDLIYFKSLLKIYSGSFCAITAYALVINNTTPPVWANTNDEQDGALTASRHDKRNMFHFSNISTKVNNNDLNTTTPSLIHIYVPNSAVTTYQNDSLWGTYCTILPISDLNSGIIYATEADWTTAGKPVGLIAEYLGLSTADLATFVSANNLTYYVAPSS